MPSLCQGRELRAPKRRHPDLLRKDLNLSGVYGRKAPCLLLAIAFSRLFFLSSHKNHTLDGRGPFPQAASLELRNSVKLLKRIVAG